MEKSLFLHFLYSLYILFLTSLDKTEGCSFYNKLGLLDLINPKNMICIKNTKPKIAKKIDLVIVLPMFKIEEIIIRKVIPSDGRITAINI